MFIYLGILTSYSQLPKNNPEHIINSIKSEAKDSSPIVIGEVLEILKSGTYQDRYILNLIRPRAAAAFVRRTVLKHSSA